MSGKISFHILCNWTDKRYRVVASETDLFRLKISKILKQLQSCIDHPVSQCTLLLDNVPLSHSLSASEAALYDGALLVLKKPPQTFKPTAILPQTPSPPPVTKPKPPPVSTPPMPAHSGSLKQKPPVEELLKDLITLSKLCEFYESQSLFQVNYDEHLINSSIVLKLQAKVKQLEYENSCLKSSFSNPNDAINSSEARLLRKKLSETENLLLHQRKSNILLRNELENIKGNIRVIVRIKPLLTRSGDVMPPQQSCISNVSDSSISVKAKNGIRSFEFSGVLKSTSSQLDTFSTIEGLAHSFVDGYNVSILAYGATGSGKTYTVSGIPNNVGVAHRFLESVYSILSSKHRPSAKGKVTSTFLLCVGISELYNDEVYDLIDGQKLRIRQRPDQSYFASPQKWITVDSCSEASTVLEEALSRRSQKTTSANATSSRSHCFFSVSLKQSFVGRENEPITSKLVIVDLAGSERISRSHTDRSKSLMKETQSINSSLSALGDVITSLALKSPHVPYRNSKLTRLLQDVLSGESKTVVFANVSAHVDDVQETVSTLGFASRIASVCTKKQFVA
ncbi:hypothetical protein P9112_009143 [Eukaryota sp. TZLM1-RC]